MKTLANFFISSLVLSLVLGCTSSKSASQGGQDGGGGDTLVSSSDQVESAVHEAVELASAADPRLNIYMAFLNYLEEMDGTDTSFSINSFAHSPALTPAPNVPDTFPPNPNAPPNTLSPTGYPADAFAPPLPLPNVPDLLVEDDSAPTPLIQHATRIVSGYDFNCVWEHENRANCPAESLLFSHDILKTRVLNHLASTIAASHLDFKENSGCFENHTDASVSQFTIGAKICFSKLRLQRISPAGLRQEILGLLLHELAHIHGYGERDAQEIQRAFSDFYSYRFASLSIKRVRQDTVKLMTTAYQTVNDASTQLNMINIGRSVCLNLLAQLDNIPLGLDPLSLRLVFGPNNKDAPIAFAVTVAYAKVFLHRALKLEQNDDADGALTQESLNYFRSLLDDIATNWVVLNGKTQPLACAKPIADLMYAHAGLVIDSPTELEAIQNLKDTKGVYPACIQVRDQN